MSESLRVWPEAPQMRKNLENWITHVDALETALAEAVRRHQDDNRTNNDRIAQLQTNIQELEAPLKGRIVMLERDLADARATVSDQDAYLKAVADRLARALEDPGAARTTSFSGLMDQVILLIEESKRMVQENL